MLLHTQMRILEIELVTLGIQGIMTLMWLGMRKDQPAMQQVTLGIQEIINWMWSVMWKELLTMLQVNQTTFIMLFYTQIKILEIKLATLGIQEIIILMWSGMRKDHLAMPKVTLGIQEITLLT